MQDWFCCLQLLRILCFRKDQIKHREILNTVGKFFAMLTDLNGEFLQDSAFFIAFLQLQFTHGIVQFNHWQGFHEQCRTT